jgi:hypothetical protein
MENKRREEPRNECGRNGRGGPPAVLTDEAAWVRRRELFYERAIGPLRQPAVYHWQDDNHPHIDVYALAASAGRPHETMVTGGMADRPMPGVRAGRETARRIELMVDVPLATDWMAVILREIAGVPFRYGTVLTEGTLIEGTTPIRSGSALRHAVLADTGRGALDGFVVEGEIVRFLSVLFITAEELRYACAMGSPALLRLLEGAGVGRVLQVGREGVL